VTDHWSTSQTRWPTVQVLRPWCALTPAGGRRLRLHPDSRDDIAVAQQKALAIPHKRIKTVETAHIFHRDG